MEGIFEKYLGDIKAAIPVNRMLLLAAAFVVSVIAHSEINHGVARHLIAIKLSQFGFGKGQVLYTAMVADILFAVVVALVSWAVYLGAARLFVSWLWKRLKLDKEVSASYAAYGDMAKVPSDIRLTAKEHANRESERRLGLVKKFAGLSELLVGFGVLFLLVSFYSGRLDLLVSLLCFFIGIGAQIAAILIYLRRVLPYELHANVLSGLEIQLGMP